MGGCCARSRYQDAEYGGNDRFSHLSPPQLRMHLNKAAGDSQPAAGKISEIAGDAGNQAAI
jgi:hypothetical protein